MKMRALAERTYQIAWVISAFMAATNIANAASIVVHNTGTNVGGRDPNYLITADATGEITPPAQAFIVTSKPAPWSNVTGADWIGPRANQTSGAAPTTGPTTYQTTFDLTGLNPATAVLNLTFLADDYLTAIRLNGNTVYTHPQIGAGMFVTATTITIGPSPNFVNGVNKLEFDVTNNGGDGNGLDLSISGTADLLPFQIRHFTNLNFGDSFIDITNAGASSTLTNCTPGQGCVGPAQNNINGNVCVNIYTFAADEQEVACCSCLVTPNALWSASVKTALLNSTLTPSFPNEVVVKMIATAPQQVTVDTVTTQSCNPGMITPTDLEPGLLAWGTTTHGLPTAAGPTFAISETPFPNATLSPAELQRDVQECQFIQVLGSGQFGICKGCSNVGLGAAAQ
jgi:hypothetical protein